MQTTSRHIRSGVPGYALTITLIFLAVALVIFGGIFSWTASNAKITLRNNQYNMSQNAAEGAVERVIGQIDRDFVYGSISNASAYTGLPSTIDQSSWPVQYTFSDTNGNPNVASVIKAPQNNSVVPLNSQYAGLFGMAQSIDVYVTATPIGQPHNVPATIHEALQFANIPLFQFAIFYNVNLEIAPGNTMIISGPVFCNQNIWEYSSSCTFASTVTAAGTNAVIVNDPFCPGKTGSGAPTFSGGGAVNNANPMVMPIGTNNSPGAILALLNLPPADFAMGTAAAYSSNGIVYPANGADLVITNFASGTNDGAGIIPYGTNQFVYFQDSGLTPVQFDYFIITNGITGKTFSTNYISPTLLGLKTNIYFAGYSWITNAVFYDWREGWNGGSGPAKRVEAVQIDVGKFNYWLTNQIVPSSGCSGAAIDQTKVLHSGQHIDSVYVYNSVALTSKQLPAVRVVNGAQLPNPGNSTTPAGFTVATPFPMYVKGNYNSQDATGSAVGLYATNSSSLAIPHTLPAALMAASITILSTSWNDAVTTKLPNPGATTVNAAMLEGIVGSTSSGVYSGGVENFLRLLENWGGTLTYNGSIVVLFYSQWATNLQVPPGGYYGAPTRNWAFDLNFKSSAKLPPLTPQIKAMIRGQW